MTDPVASRRYSKLEQGNSQSDSVLGKVKGMLFHFRSCSRSAHPPLTQFRCLQIQQGLDKVSSEYSRLTLSFEGVARSVYIQHAGRQIYVYIQSPVRITNNCQCQYACFESSDLKLV